MFDVQYRKDFVKAFGALFASEGARQHHEGCGVDHMEYDEQAETVTVYYNGGTKRVVNVALDSLAAIAYDVTKYALL